MTTVFKEVTVAVEWTITIEGKNEFGDVCRREVRIDKSWERPFDGEIGVDGQQETSKLLPSNDRFLVLCQISPPVMRSQ